MYYDAVIFTMKEMWKVFNLLKFFAHRFYEFDNIIFVIRF